MPYKPSDSYASEFTTSNPTTGAAQNADSLPVATADFTGTGTGAMALTVTNLDTGRYSATGTVPAGRVKGDVLNVSIAATVASVIGKAIIDRQILDSKRVGDLNDIAATAIVSSGAITTAGGAVTTVTNVSNGVGIGPGAISTASFAAGAIDAAAFGQGAADKAWSTTTRRLSDGTNIVLAKGTGITGFNDITAAAVWDLATAGHTTTLTFGAAMNAAGSAGDPWATALPGTYGSGTAGNIVGTNLNATVSSRSTFSGGSVTLASAGVDSISIDTVNTAGGAVVLNLRQSVAQILAMVGGKFSGASPTGGTVTVANTAPSPVTRATVVADANGNRTSVTHAPPA